MAEYNGNKYGFKLVENAAGSDYSIIITYTSAPANANVYQLQYRVIGAGSWISLPPVYMNNPATMIVPAGNNEYRIQLFYSDSTPFEYITLSKVVQDIIDNYIETPELNPLIFYNETRATTPYYQTPHFEQFPHQERGKPWMQGDVWQQVWQTTDIIKLQFSATFDPIIIELLNEEDFVIRSWVGLNRVPNREFPALYIYEFALSLANLDTGCYRFRRKLGSGEQMVIEYTRCQYISATPIPDTLYIEYRNSRFTKDVLFETGIKFGIRLFGYIDYDKMTKEKKEEGYRNQKFTSTKTASKSAKVVPVYIGDELGNPAEITNLFEEIVSLDEVTYDGAYFTLPPDKEIEYTEENGYRMRGMKAEMEPGLTRYSRRTKVNTDSQKRLMFAIAVDQQAISDLTGQGNNNVVPIFNVIIE